jgi:hypothetical protein
MLTVAAHSLMLTVTVVYFIGPVLYFGLLLTEVRLFHYKRRSTSRDEGNVTGYQSISFDTRLYMRQLHIVTPLPHSILR